MHQLIPSSSNQLLGSHNLLVISENTQTNNPKTYQKPLISNIPPIIITNNELLASIKLILDSSSADSIITKQLIDQLGCQVDHAVSAQIITVDEATKMPISKIDDFPFKVNSIMILIKVLLNQSSQHTHVPVTCNYFKTTTMSTLLIKFEEEEKRQEERRKASTSHYLYINTIYLYTTTTTKLLLTKAYMYNKPCLTCETILSNEGMWNNIPRHKEIYDKIMASVKVEDTTLSELLKIKNNLLSLPEPEYVSTFNVFGNIKNNSEEFYEHY
ncbi:hypothetical protein G9A89_023063 [Geosiphon pyriformis]|nr:hypothetical protein G9A89_023063 [Geosiphon pyriformis]